MRVGVLFGPNEVHWHWGKKKPLVLTRAYTLEKGEKKHASWKC